MHYTIKPPHSFLDSDGRVKGAGETIELSDDVAQANQDKIELPKPADEAAGVSTVLADHVDHVDHIDQDA